MIRRKLNKLIADKVKIPGTNKPFTKTSLTQEIIELSKREHPVETANKSFDPPGSTVLKTLLDKKGKMGGGDSKGYYWGNMLLEKMRIWNGEKKSKGRMKAEEE